MIDDEHAANACVKSVGEGRTDAVHAWDVLDDIILRHLVMDGNCGHTG